MVGEKEAAVAVARGKGVNGVFGGRFEEGWAKGVRGRVGD